MNILVIDVGGNNVKLFSSREQTRRKFPSGPELTAEQMVEEVRSLAADWQYDVVSLGFPGPVVRQRIAANPHNLGGGWVGFDFAAAFDCPVRLINDAAMQAVGGYQGGVMLFLGFGTGLGTAMIIDKLILPMELAHAPYKELTFEDYVGKPALAAMGKRKWREQVHGVIDHFRTALEPDDILLGGGNVKHLEEIPAGCRRGQNADAFTGGIRLWDKSPATPHLADETR